MKRNSRHQAAIGGLLLFLVATGSAQRQIALGFDRASTRARVVHEEGRARAVSHRQEVPVVRECGVHAV